MKAYDLQATQSNIKDTFLSNQIDRNDDVVRFCTILDSIDGNFSIALDGKWGSGKTFFVKQAKLLLDAFNEFSCNPIEASEAEQIKQIASKYKIDRANEFNLQSQVAVYYDAWTNDNDEDPILSLIYAIIESTDTNIDIGKKHDLLKIFAALGDCFTGKRVSSFLEALKGDNLLSSIKSGKSICDLMKDFFDGLLLEHGNRLVIFIDELDRCKPSYAVQLLERIKHYCEDERVTFVFSVNTEQLQYTIKHYYGEEFNASRYLDRFFDLRMTLPQANMQKFYKSIEFYDTSSVFDNMCRKVIDAYHFEMREISKFVHLAKIAAYKPTHDNSYTFRSLDFALSCILPIMIGLKIYDESLYTAFVTGKNSDPLLDIYINDTSNYFGVELLLNKNEAYDDKRRDDGIICVTVESKIKAVYSALFVQDYQFAYEGQVGRLKFNADTKRSVLRTASLLSDFADYSY